MLINAGLGGRIKLRYSDFIVNEIYFEDNKEMATNIIDWEENQTELYDKIPERTNDYLHMTMQKINTDLQNVIKSIALVLRIAKSRIGYAGLKDKRGITSQRISIYSPDLDLLKKLNKKMVKFHSFSWHDDKVKIGDLVKNKFTIAIRNIDKDEDTIKPILRNFAKKMDNGLPNVFGEQRFGGVRDITHEVGYMFIQGKIKEAVMHYLTKLNDMEDEQTTEARKLIAQGDFVNAIKNMPKDGLRYERAILNHLIKNPNDFVNAWEQLPESIIYLFTHAYQSFLFNEYVNRRIKLYGTDFAKPQKGDIVDDEGYVLGPLFGYDFELATNEIGDLEKQILKEQNLDLNDFKVNSFPKMSVAGARRRIKMNVYNFKLLNIEGDEFNEGKMCCTITFELPKGCYATTLTEELINK